MEPVEFGDVDPNLENHLLGRSGEIAKVETKLVGPTLVVELLLFDQAIALELELNPACHLHPSTDVVELSDQVEAGQALRGAVIEVVGETCRREVAFAESVAALEYEQVAESRVSCDRGDQPAEDVV